MPTCCISPSSRSCPAGLGGLAQATGYAAVAAFVAFWPVIVLLTFGAAWVSFRYVEAPMMDFGKRLIGRPAARQLVPAE